MRLICLVFFVFSACSSLFVPNSGPSYFSVSRKSDFPKMKLINLNQGQIDKAKKVEKERALHFSEETPKEYIIKKGDNLSVSIYESSPQVLFPDETNNITLKSLSVDLKGFIRIPFVGRVKAAGHSVDVLTQRLQKKLERASNNPQVLINIESSSTSKATVVGDVSSPQEVSLHKYPKLRILDAFAQTGGGKSNFLEMSVKINRNQKTLFLPLKRIIEDPSLNLALKDGDIVSFLHENYSYVALGATNKNDEISFSSSGISLLQAVARAGGLNDNRSDARAVFVFRYEAPETVLHKRFNNSQFRYEKIPTIYTLDLEKPESYFLGQNFLMKDKDVLFVSNSRGHQLQKFLRLLQSVFANGVGFRNVVR